MADKDASKDRTAWGLARRLSAIYGLATTVGFFYASAYFGHFDIDILNFVAPIGRSSASRLILTVRSSSTKPKEEPQRCRYRREARKRGLSSSKARRSKL